MYEHTLVFKFPYKSNYGGNNKTFKTCNIREILRALQSYHVFSISSNVVQHSGATGILKDDIWRFYPELSVMVLMKTHKAYIECYIVVDNKS